MAGWHLQARAHLLALACIACAAGLGAGTASAQSGELIYEKQLDLTLNPVPVEGAGPKTPMPERDPSFYDRVTSLPGLIPEAPGGDDNGRSDARVIMGKPAPPGAWRSTVNLAVSQKGPDGKQTGFLCGGSLIAPTWVLTAAHCVFQLQTAGLGGLTWVTAFADDTRVFKGTPLRVKAVYVNRAFAADWILNDLALLELEKASDLPRQKLAAGAGQARFLAAGTMMTIVGWGRTEPYWQPGSQSTTSPVLLQAQVPIASKAVCDEFRSHVTSGRPGRPLTNAEFCAGYGEMEKKMPSNCNGDSGGPVFVAGSTGEPIQAGIVSWGPNGCRSLYAAYTNVGNFEPWIRQRVPNAVFAMPGDGGSSDPLAKIAGVARGGPPSPYGQCAIDIYADGQAVNLVHVGAELTVRVTSGVAGQIAVFSRTSERRVTQLYPNGYRKAADDGASRGVVRAGEVVAVPDPADGISLTVSPPEGRYEVIALVMPEGGMLTDVTRRFQDMTPIAGFDAVLRELADDVARTPAASFARAVCTRQFLVVGR